MPERIRLLVCGSRKWSDRDLILDTLTALTKEFDIECVIEGEAPGADTIARRMAEALSIPVLPYPADWGRYRGQDTNPAGRIRNQQMLDEGKPTHCLAFSTSRPPRGGTLDMIYRARKATLPVAIIYNRATPVKWAAKPPGFFKI